MQITASISIENYKCRVKPKCCKVVNKAATRKN